MSKETIHIKSIDDATRRISQVSFLALTERNKIFQLCQQQDDTEAFLLETERSVKNGATFFGFTIGVLSAALLLLDILSKWFLAFAGIPPGYIFLLVAVLFLLAALVCKLRGKRYFLRPLVRTFATTGVLLLATGSATIKLDRPQIKIERDGSTGQIYKGISERIVGIFVDADTVDDHRPLDQEQQQLMTDNNQSHYRTVVGAWNERDTSGQLGNETDGISTNFRPITVSFKRFRTVEIPLGQSGSIRGDYGTLNLESNGRYTYEADNTVEIGRFDQFTVTLSAGTAQQVKQDVFVSVFNQNLSGEWIGTDAPDSFFGTEEADTIFGNSGPDSINGREGGDTIHGNDGPDDLFGASGPDQIHGGPDQDVIYGDDGPDQIWGGDGNDSIYGDGGASDPTSGRDKIYAGSGNDFVFGGKLPDEIFGESGNDDLYGGDGPDSIFGGPGLDYLIGQRGKDILTGGLGADTFWAFPEDDFDIITDFNLDQRDAMEVSNLVGLIGSDPKTSGRLTARITDAGTLISVVEPNGAEIPIFLLEGVDYSFEKLIERGGFVFASR